VAGEVEDSSVLDAALIAAAQAVEHYEMLRLRLRLGWKDWFIPWAGPQVDVE
jgi:ferritin-like metal-binding protein YciE